jgi:hypothetical protein
MFADDFAIFVSASSAFAVGGITLFHPRLASTGSGAGALSRPSEPSPRCAIFLGRS